MPAAILRTFRKQWDAITAGVIGLSLACTWIASPVPDIRDLTEVEARLESYTIETANRDDRGVKYVFFSVLDRNERFWTESVKPHEAPSVLAFKDSLLKFSIAPPGPYRSLARGDAVKAYGMNVNDIHVRSVESALQSDR